MKKKRAAKSPGVEDDLVAEVKELLAEERHRIRLFDILASGTEQILGAISEEKFPSNAGWSEDEFRDRVERYNALLRDWITVQALLAYWSTPVTHSSLTLGPKRFSGFPETSSGITGWLSLRWYPCLLLLYAGGIAAVANKQYGNLRELFLADAEGGMMHPGQRQPYALAVMRGIADVTDSFKLLPGHERHQVPLSEYIFQLMQPLLARTLFLGTGYEAAFDRFEVLLALECAHESDRKDDYIRGPIGRFGWKFSGHASNDPYRELVTEAKATGSSWLPLEAGLFDGSLERFVEIADGYAAWLARRRWF